jgi:hypothetical protein
MTRPVIFLVLMGCSDPPKSEIQIGETDRLTPAQRVELRRWREDSLEKRTRWIGTAPCDVCTRYIRPLLEREQIPHIPWAKSLGMTEFGSDTPAVVEADAHRNGYDFYKGIDPGPDEK